MIKVLINGANGRMGKNVKTALLNAENMTAFCGVDIAENFSDADFPVYKSFAEVKGTPDVIIDFSSAKSLPTILDYATKNNVPAVLCSTGYTAEDIENIKKASEKVALFRSANMSLGVNVLISAIKLAAQKLLGFDVEIIEKHHNQKADAPSGTALMLADGIKQVSPEKYYVYGREGIVGKRAKDEIGIHAIRGGNIVGEHQVIFAGNSETLTFTHEATDRAVFATGAVKAGEFIVGKPAGLYDMNDLLGE